MNRETDDLERIHLRLYSSNLLLLRAALPRGELNNYIRDTLNEHVELNHAKLAAMASGRR